MLGLQIRSGYFDEEFEHIQISASIVEKGIDEARQDYVPKYEWSETVFAGLPAHEKLDGTGILFFRPSSLEGSTEMYVFKHSYDGNKNEPSPEYKKVFEEMLASFKFLKTEDNAGAEKRNAQRRSDVNTMLNAIYQYSIDNNGNIPESITDTEREICVSEDYKKTDCGELAWLGELLKNEMYLVSLPVDPSGNCSANGTCYTVMLSYETGRVIVTAPDAELGVSIQVRK